MRGSSIRARPRESAKQPLHDVANHANPLESLLALHNNGLKGSRIPVSGSRLGANGTRQRPSSARPSSSKGFPEGMMGIIGQSKAVAEMQSAVRNVGRNRPASASVHGRQHQQQHQQQASSLGVFGGGGIRTNGDALSVGGKHLHTGAEVAMGSSAEDYIPVKKLGEGASGVVYLVKLRSSRDGEANSMYVMKQVEIGKGRGISAPSSERFSAIARHERDGALREVSRASTHQKLSVLERAVCRSYVSCLSAGVCCCFFPPPACIVAHDVHNDKVHGEQISFARAKPHSSTPNPHSSTSFLGYGLSPSFPHPSPPLPLRLHIPFSFSHCTHIECSGQLLAHGHVRGPHTNLNP
jgi:hypothetical protein